MFRFRPAFSTTAALLVAVLLAGGCAGTGMSALDRLQADTVRQLTADCYWNHEGERLLFGGHHVHVACRRWATDRVAVRFADATGSFD